VVRLDRLSYLMRLDGRHNHLGRFFSRPHIILAAYRRTVRNRPQPRGRAMRHRFPPLPAVEAFGARFTRVNSTARKLNIGPRGATEGSQQKHRPLKARYRIDTGSRSICFLPGTGGFPTTLASFDTPFFARVVALYYRRVCQTVCRVRKVK